MCGEDQRFVQVWVCSPILYIKANMVSVFVDKMSVCVDKNWAVPGRFFQSLPVPLELVTNRAGRSGQPLWGAARGAISIKKILGENQGTCI